MPVAASPLGDLVVWPPTYRSYPNALVSQSGRSRMNKSQLQRAPGRKKPLIGRFRWYVRLLGSTRG